jgi:subtilisin family serine protease
MYKSVMRFTIAIGAIVAAACVYDAPVTPTGDTISAARTSSTAQSNKKPFVINFSGNQVPVDLVAQVAAAGGQVTSSLDRIGVALVSSDDPAFATRAATIPGVATVDADTLVEWVRPERFAEAGEAAGAGEVTPNAVFGTGETFRHVQWAPDAIHAPEAWDLGQRGAGVRVAVLDGGIRDTHIDIAPRLDAVHSTSFVPGVPFNADFSRRRSTGACDSTDSFWHATHVSGIIAAPGAENTPFPNLGTVGIAPSATIIGVKVLNCGSGTFGQVMQGIYYAATPITEGGAGADVINMSLGATFKKTGRAAVELIQALNKATTYAYDRGVTVVAAMGNEATDIQGSIISVPATSSHVIAVSATGPLGFAFGATNYDRPASYTNFGHQAVTFAAPGGDFALPGNAVCTFPRNPSGVGAQFCWALDMVIAPCRGSAATSISSYCWAAGTSMASPAVAGVAALIIGKYGRVGPAEVERRLRESADDLGKKGKDDLYGGGRVNALKAIQ